MKKRTSQSRSFLSVALAIILGCFSAAVAEEYYAGGDVVDIDYEIVDYIWVEDATVNLYDGAYIVADAFYGDIYATSGAVINVYGGMLDGIFYVADDSTEFESPLVTVYGSEFAIDGIFLDPSVTEVYLENEYLSGVYASGSEFSLLIDCSLSGETIQLVWVVEETEMTPAEQMEQIMTYYDQAVEEGTIEAAQFGRGRNSHRWNRFRSKHDPFEKTLLIAQRLIDREYDIYATRVLTMVEKKCDGENRPRDIITGDGVAELNEMINELIESLSETEQ